MGLLKRCLDYINDQNKEEIELLSFDHLCGSGTALDILAEDDRPPHGSGLSMLLGDEE